MAVEWAGGRAGRRTYLVPFACKSDVIVNYSPIYVVASSFERSLISFVVYNPAIRISRNIDLIIIHDFIFDVIITIVISNSRAICTSKIRKIKAIRKNRSENGSHARLFGPNSHSNGHRFSQSSIFFL
jgi:hypothetical protein